MVFIATMTIRDGKKLQKQLMRLGRKGTKKVNRKAVLESLKPIASAAKKNAPVGKTRRLRKGIGRKTKSYPNGNAIGIVGKQKDRTAPHYHLVELGHRIAKGGALRRLSGKRKGQLGKKGASEGTVAGFVPGRHFMRRALQANRQKALSIYTAWLRKGIVTEAKKK